MTDHTPITDKELAEIEARANAARTLRYDPVADLLVDCDGNMRGDNMARTSPTVEELVLLVTAKLDIPRLISEVKRLREENAKLLTSTHSRR